MGGLCRFAPLEIRNSKYMMKARGDFQFKYLPRDFAGLCSVLSPRPIRDRSDYENVVEITDAMALWNEDFSPDQEDYFDLLCILIENYDKEPRSM